MVPWSGKLVLGSFFDDHFAFLVHFDHLGVLCLLMGDLLQNLLPVLLLCLSQHLIWPPPPLPGGSQGSPRLPLSCFHLPDPSFSPLPGKDAHGHSNFPLMSR